MDQAKVIQLKRENKSTSQHVSLLHNIRKLGKKQISSLIDDLFNNTDDALFEMADRSVADDLQIMYFDSMRMIRIHRESITQTFLLRFEEHFNLAFTISKDDVDDEKQSDEDPDYALIGQDELELSVAVSGIVSKITSQFSLPIMELTKRLDQLTDSQDITERSNPFGPYALGSSFARALADLEVNIKIRIIIMKLFERFVMERLGPVYDAINDVLIEAKILPDLSAKSKTRNKPAPPPPRATESTPTQPGDGHNVHELPIVQDDGKSVAFAAIQTLLASARTQQGMPPPSQLPALPPSTVLSTLDQMQQSSGDEKIDPSVIPAPIDLRSLIASAAAPDNSKSIGRAEDDTINFVGLLFDFILSDRNLAVPMKALLSRLQIPMVKLALMDRSFFEKSSHPARSLLNELSSAGVGWSNNSDLQRDDLYENIESIVLQILGGFSENPDMFSDLLDEFRQFVGQESRRSVLVEQRVRETEAGKARTKQAKLQVQELVNDKASGQRLPIEAGKFVSEHWSKVLTMRHVKVGEDGQEWIDGVALLDEMLMLLQPMQSRADISKRVQRTGDLISRITTGMEETGCATGTIESFTTWLKVHLLKLSRNDLDHLDSEEKPELDEPTNELPEVQLTPPEEVSTVELPVEIDTRLESLCEGAWLEITDDDDQVRRCKLATVTHPGGVHIFVNRRGMKILELGRAKLGELLTDERAVVLEEAQVFDRALQSVISHLRDVQNVAMPST